MTLYKLVRGPARPGSNPVLPSATTHLSYELLGRVRLGFLVVPLSNCM
jgi:hypothetical protein